MRHQLDERAGFTLIELMIAVAILATLVVATASVMTSSARNNQLAREEAAALRAAKAMISELQAYSSTEIMAGYTGGYTFRVNLVEGQTQPLGLLSAGVPQNEGEVVVITEEEPDESAYGRDLSPSDGNPDGIDLNGDGDRTDVLNTTAAGCIFPLDLNNDGDTDDSAVAAGDLQVVPVVVIIRWRTFGGGGRAEERRIQMMTVTGKHRP